ncbi:MAG: carbamoyltransferase [Planctomycetes bacterium]|nr:carbamoyltransferase [Planctomycetota bacterium]MCW8136297.1 carbamoyltransferase [Planctomycetota bacterium]
MLLVLGINAYHADSAAVLLRDGCVVAAVAEERLNRIKHCAGFPALAIREVLRIGGVELRDVDEIAVARDSTANLRSKLGWVLRNLHRAGKVARKRLADRAGLADFEAQIADACGASREALRAKVRRVEHHLAHAASTFLASPFERAAILTLDGFGDFASTMLALGEGSSIKPLARVTYPHSLGILYTAICQFIGFDRYGDEGKVMGLAPYGEPEYADFLARLLRLTDDGFELDLEYFNHHTQGVSTGSDEYGSPHFAHLFTPQLEQALGPARNRGDALTDRDRNLAASLQLRLEDAFLHLARLLHRRTGGDALCLAGGVALNGVANGRLLRESPFSRLYVQPAAGDDGTALGAAAWVAVQSGAARHEMTHAYHGPSFSETEMAQQVTRIEGCDVQTLDEAELCAQTAQLVAQGRVVGWFQGAMEWGPRALGNRSIVAHPGLPGMKDTLNARIKQREPFRPFAPSIKAERLADYFESNHESPFMLHVYKTRQDKWAELCAVDHVDHTGRVQTVTREQNPRYWRLIDEFEQLTGTPVVLNTSFNENEPIVCTPAQAVDCFSRTRMDALAIGNTLVTRRGLPAAELQENHAARA